MDAEGLFVALVFGVRVWWRDSVRAADADPLAALADPIPRRLTNKDDSDGHGR